MPDSLAAAPLGAPPVLHSGDGAHAISVTQAGSSNFGRYAWGVLAYTILVVLFGAVVRITGSGAGCGQHWPTCQGQIVLLPKRMETAIELSHRATSALCLVLVVALSIGAVRCFRPGEVVRTAVWFALGTVAVEALIGASLVLFRLVGHNDSLARALVMGAHLVSTCFLTAAIAVAAWAATHPVSIRLPGALVLMLATALLGLLLVSMTGAITALGDTVYPPSVSGATLGAGALLLERMRAVHPILAMLVGFLLVILVPAAARRAQGKDTLTFGRASLALVFFQASLGVLNIWLKAPGWMQVFHLAIAMLLWTAMVLFSASAALKA